MLNIFCSKYRTDMIQSALERYTFGRYQKNIFGRNFYRQHPKNFYRKSADMVENEVKIAILTLRIAGTRNFYGSQHFYF